MYKTILPSLPDTSVTISPTGIVSLTSVLSIGLTNCGALSLISVIQNSTLRDVDSSKAGLLYNNIKFSCQNECCMDPGLKWATLVDPLNQLIMSNPDVT